MPSMRPKESGPLSKLLSSPVYKGFNNMDNLRAQIIVPFVNSRTLTINSGDRDAYYTEIWQVFLKLKEYCIYNSIWDVEKEYIDHMNKQIVHLYESCRSTLETIKAQLLNTTNKESYTLFNKYIDNFVILSRTSILLYCRKKREIE